MTNESGGIVELTEGERHRILAAERRRVVCDVIADERSSFELRELARKVAAREDGADDEDVDTIATTLHHVHLPLMAELGAVSYDAEHKHLEPHGGLTL